MYLGTHGHKSEIREDEVKVTICTPYKTTSSGLFRTEVNKNMLFISSSCDIQMLFFTELIHIWTFRLRQVLRQGYIIIQ